MSHAPLSATALQVRLEALARFTDVPGEMTRLTLSPAHKAAAGEVARWFAAAGMAVHLDATGSVVGRYEGTRPDAPALIIGSHIDTVRNAGIYDGNLGVVVGLAVVEELNRTNTRLPFPIEVFAFADEEGVRFPSTLTSSRALAGRFDPATLEHRDADGISRREALIAFGVDPAAIATASRAEDARAYVEVHIEQGPVLEKLGLPLGIVTAIAGATRAQVRVSGEAGHSGTLPMELRHDALAGAAEMVLAAEKRAQGEPGLVATVGTLSMPGGAVNVVPGAVQFSLDVRAPDDPQRNRAFADIEARCREIAAARGLCVTLEVGYDAAAAPCDAGLQAALAEAVADVGAPVHHLPSGAGHDGLSLNGVMPIAMLFVRSTNGSHNPREHAAADDIALAAQALHACVLWLAAA
ncbi:Zn-dependent hydrolase [Azorhizobium oxalatiphilum]|uniref:Zn-dependent hydrolase n=1 Tax=Azorhizobium oxalatiphilum TaxID=980631 RepID=A0A917F5N4_9HYPH|nr:allantoate amidohydrolase [Azorhizobium oxalatiphilum]GGF49018.1 Zn-dependent hydrolase [Azorhizobium oxalatiphilum]